LNSTPNIATDAQDVDQELDDLMSSFQRLSKNVTEAQPCGGKKRRAKQRKNKLLVGDNSNSHLLVSQSTEDELDDERQMKNIGERLGFRFGPIDEVGDEHRSF
ncbi:hypothetical protein Tco_0314412, partial [Tanacetum coccineum]